MLEFESDPTRYIMNKLIQQPRQLEQYTKDLEIFYGKASILIPEV